MNNNHNFLDNIEQPPVLILILKFFIYKKKAKGNTKWKILKLKRESMSKYIWLGVCSMVKGMAIYR